ncbi:carbohydrate-binding protein [Robiginitalea sp.]|uniref:carbohydrate-binding protein n=1 Tax=Robiginitalea sp. TaxID=1902411 RepID=UPI003C76F683
MKNGRFIYPKIPLVVFAALVLLSACEREVSDEVKFATFPDNPEVFIDGFSGGLEYLPFDGSKLDAFSVDPDVKYAGTTSMRFDVPNFGDPSGSFAGAVFPDMGGRDLSGYDALTFWAKATEAAIVNEIGFGVDFGENKYRVNAENIRLGTGWAKYIISIPDPFLLTVEKGMFFYAAGPQDGDGFTFWIDELQFERLGTLGQPKPAIFNGEDRVETTFLDVQIPITGLTHTINLGAGGNRTVSAAPAYYDFSSTDNEVARVSESGVITIVGNGTATITALLAGVKAAGSLTVEVEGSFQTAPLPPARNPEDVISVFSDAYANVPVEYYNGFFTPDGQTTLGGADINIGGDNVIRYTDLNFVAIKTLNTVNANAMTHYHLDIQVEDPQISPSDFIRVLLVDAGPDNVIGTGDDTEAFVEFDNETLISRQWVSLDIPLTDFVGMNTGNLALYFFVSDATISNILLDNIYFYKE